MSIQTGHRVRPAPGPGEAAASADLEQEGLIPAGRGWGGWVGAEGSVGGIDAAAVDSVRAEEEHGAHAHLKRLTRA